jgi:hypothetical protein
MRARIGTRPLRGTQLISLSPGASGGLAFVEKRGRSLPEAPAAARRAMAAALRRNRWRGSRTPQSAQGRGPARRRRHAQRPAGAALPRCGRSGDTAGARAQAPRCDARRARGRTVAFARRKGTRVLRGRARPFAGRLACDRSSRAGCRWRDRDIAPRRADARLPVACRNGRRRLKLRG